MFSDTKYNVLHVPSTHRSILKQPTTIYIGAPPPSRGESFSRNPMPGAFTSHSVNLFSRKCQLCANSLGGGENTNMNITIRGGREGQENLHLALGMGSQRKHSTTHFLNADWIIRRTSRRETPALLSCREIPTSRCYDSRENNAFSHICFVLPLPLPVK